jgi:DNA invertase Pin-like site-specific DNA recombinase
MRSDNARWRWAWPIERVVVIDRDLGQSGAAAADREGFQQLVRDVGLGRAGLVMGLEVSRFARNSICALTARSGRARHVRKILPPDTRQGYASLP